MGRENRCGSCDIRDAILNSVGKLIVRYGYKKMTMDDIAHEAGIGKGTIYLYFPSKEEVALGWIDRAHHELRDRLHLIADSNLDTHSKLREMLMYRVISRFEQVQDMAESLDELFSSIRSTLLERRDHNQKLEADLFAGVLETGKARGDIIYDDCHRTATALLLATNSLLPYSLSAIQLGDRDEIIQRVNTISNLLLNGLSSNKDQLAPGGLS